VKTVQIRAPNVGAWWRGLPKKTRDLYLGLGMIAATGLVFLYMAGELDVRIPKVDVASAAQATAAFVAGLAVLTAAGVMLYRAVVSANALWALVAILTLLLGLSLVGVTVGLPPVLQGLLDVLNALIRLLNLVIDLISKVV
jgi:hypothetical protein